MRNHPFTIFAVLLVLLPWTPVASAQHATGNEQSGNPLAPFERLIGGQWHIEGSYQEFEWGLGKQSVRSRGFFVIDGVPRLVSEGVWFWHPQEKKIKGVFTAIDMPVVFFDYTTRFEQDRMVSELLSFDANGTGTAYVETWEFTDDTQYVWKLLKETVGGVQEVMSATYSRTH